MEAVPSKPQGEQAEDHDPQCPDRKGLQYRLLPDTSVVSEYQSPCYISSICPTKEDTVWTCDYVSNIVTLLDNKGRVRQEVLYPVCVTDLSLCPTTQHLWTCSEEDHSIRQLKTMAQPKLMFTTEKKPLCLCVTVERNIIVGMSQNITMFTRKGRVVLSSVSMQPGRASKMKKSLITSPVKLSLCPVTGNLAVVEKDVTGAKSNPHILVLNQEFQVMFRYRPCLQRVYTTGPCPFDPRDVVYDLMGNIVICDYRNHNIHFLTGYGQCLRVICKDISAIQTIGIDRENMLWTVSGVDKVKHLKYSEVQMVESV